MAVEIAEHLLGESGGGGGDGGRALADRRLDTGAAACVECLPEEAVEQRPGRPELECVAHLAENLALTGHERIEPGRDAKEVQCRAVVAEAIEDRCESCAFVTREREQRGARALVEVVSGRIVAGEVELGAVARREHDRLAPSGTGAGQRAGERRCPVRVHRNALSQLDGGLAMRDADESELHDAKWVRGRTTATSANPARRRKAKRRPWRPVSRRRSRPVA